MRVVEKTGDRIDDQDPLGQVDAGNQEVDQRYETVATSGCDRQSMLGTIEINRRDDSDDPPSRVTGLETDQVLRPKLAVFEAGAYPKDRWSESIRARPQRRRGR